MQMLGRQLKKTGFVNSFGHFRHDNDAALAAQAALLGAVKMEKTAIETKFVVATEVGGQVVPSRSHPIHLCRTLRSSYPSAQDPSILVSICSGAFDSRPNICPCSEGLAVKFILKTKKGTHAGAHLVQLNQTVVH
jgi:hypothetical protein